MDYKAVSTDILVDRLCDDLPERLTFRSPLVYFSGWLISSVLAVLVYFNIFLAVRFDLLHRFVDLNFLISVGAMFLGSCFFAYGALANAIPGSRSVADRLGLGCVAIWMGLVVASMVLNVSGLASGKVYLRFEFSVFIHMVVAGLIPIALLWAFVMRLAPVKPKRIAMSACMASFMLSAAMLRFFYVHLYNGADCGYSLFLWIMMPFIISSLVSWKLVHPKFCMRTPDKKAFLDSRRHAASTVLATS